MSTSRAIVSGRVGMRRRRVVPVGVFPAIASQEPRSSTTPWVLVLVLAISIVGLWFSAGLLG